MREISCPSKHVLKEVYLLTGNLGAADLLKIELSPINKADIGKRITNKPLKGPSSESIPILPGQESPLALKKTEKGKPLLVDHERYKFRQERSKVIKGVRRGYWICLHEAKFNCKARLVTEGEIGENLKIVYKAKLHVCQLPW